MLLEARRDAGAHPTGRRRHGRRAQRPTPTLALLAARRWGRSRPVGGGLLLLVAGLAIVFLPAARLTVVLLPGLAGATGFLFGAGLCLLGLFLWFQPRSHALVGSVAILTALASLVTTNLGGLGVGLLLGVLGGALGFAWSPDPPRRHAPVPIPDPEAQAAATDVLAIPVRDRTRSANGVERDT